MKGAGVQVACYIFGAGSFYGLSQRPAPGDTVIAADGGWEPCRGVGLTPDLLLGDFDSLHTVPDFARIRRVPVEKDDTDMMAAIKKGLSLGCNAFYLYGATGGRFDHTMANVQALTFLAKRGARGFLFGRDTVCTVVQDGFCDLPARSGGYVSVFCLSDCARGVDISGLKYEIQNAGLTNAFPLGVSNEFKGENARVSVQSGTLLIIAPR